MQAIIKALPEPYARAMLLHECQWLLRTVPLLVAAPPGFVHSLVVRFPEHEVCFPSYVIEPRPFYATLQPLLSPRTIMGAETVLELDEPPHHWWLLSRGRAGEC